MGRRGGVLTRQCTHEGCRETGRWDYDSQREGNEMARNPYYREWRCVRHASPDKVLSFDQPARQVTLVCTEEFRPRHNFQTGQDEQRSIGKFWKLEGSESRGSGFNFSEAHKAFAADFPVGTRLVLTAYVETPEQAEIAREINAAG